jgi:serine/threonine protein kinase
VLKKKSRLKFLIAKKKRREKKLLQLLFFLVLVHVQPKMRMLRLSFPFKAAKKTAVSPLRFGEFTCTHAVGEGSYGQVYSTEDGVHAVKVVRNLDEENDMESLKQLAKEVLVLRHLPPHPNTVVWVNTMVVYPHLVFVMEACPLTLWDLHVQRPAYTLPDALSIVGDVLKGVAHLHAFGVSHRDLKPANLLVAADGTVKLCDFGLADLHGAGDRHAVTRYWRPPELEVGAPFDEKVDMWSVGAIFAELLAMVAVPADPYTPLFYSVKGSLLSRDKETGDVSTALLAAMFDVLGNAGPYEAVPRATAGGRFWRAQPATGLKPLFAEHPVVAGMLQYDPAQRLTAEAALGALGLEPHATAPMAPATLAAFASLEPPPPNSRKRWFWQTEERLTLVEKIRMFCAELSND